MVKRTQAWFGGILESKNLKNEGAEKWIRKGSIAIYHEQYWLKLRSHLKDAYPKLSKLIGDEFDEKITLPYFDERPPTSWSLYELGEDLPEWMVGKGPLLWNEVATLDRAFRKAFVSKEFPPMKQMLEGTKLVLQPFVHLLHFRNQPFTHEALDFYMVVYRQGETKWKEIGKEPFSLLGLFKEPKTLEEAFETVDIQNPNKISSYFNLFIYNNWITCEP